MYRNAIGVMFLGLMIGGCASDRMVDSPGSASSTPTQTPVVATPDKSPNVVAESSSAIDTPTTESRSMNQSRSTQNRIAAETQEETLDTCLADIPQGTVGQKMLAEQTCRRNHAAR